MKPNPFPRRAVVILAIICVLAAVVRWNATAQSNPSKQTKASTPTAKQKAPPAKGKINPELLVNIATIHVNDGSADKVRKTLKAAKISVMVMGAKTYGVLVHQKDHDRALKLLKVDAKKQHYWIQFGR